MKCMVVDDSALTRRILTRSLRAIGFTDVVEAVDGAQALQACTPDVDLVLTDWNMPGMTGMQFVRGLRSNPAFASLPVLLITSRSARDDVAEAVSAGVNGYILKPITPEVLKAHVERALARPDITGTDG
jgi:two-component system, chemotaxis family, chemotaxis protein CheY